MRHHIGRDGLQTGRAKSLDKYKNIIIMSWKLYEYSDTRGGTPVRDYLSGFDKRTKAKIRAKIDALGMHGTGLPPKLLTGTPHGHIKKLRVTGNVQVRIMVCAGPAVPENEFTLLFATQERDRELVDPDAYDLANERRQEIIENPERRCVYERIP